VRDAIYSVGARNESRVLSLMSALPVNAGIPASPMRMLSRCSEHPLSVPIERSQHADARQTARQGMRSLKARDQSAMMQPRRANVGAARIAHCAKHPGLQISIGHVVGKATDV
jgi:hypothetical protein